MIDELHPFYRKTLNLLIEQDQREQMPEHAERYQALESFLTRDTGNDTEVHLAKDEEDF